MSGINPVLIVLEKPYSVDYKSGIMYGRSELGGRRYIRLTPKLHNKNKTMSISYARYLYQVHLWKKGFGWISRNKEVDHVNNDFLDDRIDNFQLLSHEFNMKKMNSFRGHSAYVVVCFYCGKQHIVKKWSLDEHMNKPSSPAVCCSRSCVSSSFGDTKLIGKTCEWVKTHQVQYEIKAHHFEYEDWYGNYYPYTEIVSVRSRELTNYDGIDNLRTRLPVDIKYLAEHELRAPIDRALAIKEYIDDEKSISVIAEFLGLHETTVYNYIDRYNIIVPHREERDEKISRIEFLLKEGISPMSVAEQLAIPYNTVIHHTRRLGIETNLNARKRILKEEVPKLYLFEKLSKYAIATKLNIPIRSVERIIGLIKQSHPTYNVQDSIGG